MYTWQELVRLPESQLAGCDIATVNLVCAKGLPGTENLDVPACLRIVDSYAVRVREHTARIAGQFHSRPEAFNHSWAFFRVMDMMTVLQRDLGIQADSELNKADDSYFFRRPEHLFLHGIVMGKGGTCSSLPPLFVAVGRRLGYPLKLVTTFRHVFARWDGEGERFNIECTARGLLSSPDDYYRTWPKPLTDEQIRRYGALQSLTPRQELACFLSNRGHCLSENGHLRYAVFAYAYACQVDPDNWGHSHSLVEAMNRWDRELLQRLMPGFPSLTIHFPPRRFPSLPKDLEHGILHLMTKENLLNNPNMQKQFWEPLRRDGRLPPIKPVAAYRGFLSRCQWGRCGYYSAQVAPAQFRPQTGTTLLGENAMFDSRIGRWTSEDPLGFEAGDENLYRYVGNNPTNATDPSGLTTIPFPLPPANVGQATYGSGSRTLYHRIVFESGPFPGMNVPFPRVEVQTGYSPTGPFPMRQNIGIVHHLSPQLLIERNSFFIPLSSFQTILQRGPLPQGQNAWNSWFAQHALYQRTSNGEIVEALHLAEFNLTPLRPEPEFHPLAIGVISINPTGAGALTTPFPTVSPVTTVSPITQVPPGLGSGAISTPFPTLQTVITVTAATAGSPVTNVSPAISHPANLPNIVYVNAPGVPLPAVVAQSEADALRAAWQQKPIDLGLVVYKPSTGEIHVGNIDAHGGHDLFLQNLGIADSANWRGATVASNGSVVNNSGLNVGLGHGQGMPPADFQQVVQALRQAGLAN